MGLETKEEAETFIAAHAAFELEEAGYVTAKVIRWFHQHFGTSEFKATLAKEGVKSRAKR